MDKHAQKRQWSTIRPKKPLNSLVGKLGFLLIFLKNSLRSYCASPLTSDALTNTEHLETANLICSSSIIKEKIINLKFGECFSLSFFRDLSQTNPRANDPIKLTFQRTCWPFQKNSPLSLQTFMGHFFGRYTFLRESKIAMEWHEFDVRNMEENLV